MAREDRKTVPQLIYISDFDLIGGQFKVNQHKELEFLVALAKCTHEVQVHLSSGLRLARHILLRQILWY